MYAPDDCFQLLLSPEVLFLQPQESLMQVAELHRRRQPAKLSPLGQSGNRVPCLQVRNVLALHKAGQRGVLPESALLLPRWSAQGQVSTHPFASARPAQLLKMLNNTDQRRHRAVPSVMHILQYGARADLICDSRFRSLRLGCFCLAVAVCPDARNSCACA